MIIKEEPATFYFGKAIISIFLLLMNTSSFAQSFRVCTYTDQGHNEKGCGNRFVLNADTLTLNLIVDLENENVKADTVIYSFFKYDVEGIREFVSEVPLKVSKSGSYIYLPIDFYNEGDYYVKVRKKDDTFLAEGRFAIIFSDNPAADTLPKK